MMETQGSVTRLLGKLQSTEQAVRDVAARVIWERYFRDLVDLAKRQIDGRTRRREDEEDLLQSAYKSFCLRQTRGEFDLAGRDEFWRLLVTITLCKARNAAKRHRMGKRDVRREEFADRDAKGADATQWVLEQMDAAGPTPAEAAVLSEELERRLADLSDPQLREIALRKLEGYTNSEIAELEKCTERTIERKLRRIRDRWSEIEHRDV